MSGFGEESVKADDKERTSREEEGLFRDDDKAIIQENERTDWEEVLAGQRGMADADERVRVSELQVKREEEKKNRLRQREEDKKNRMPPKQPGSQKAQKKVLAALAELLYVL